MPSRYSALSGLECSRCAARHDADRLQGTCPCGAPLLARYDTDRVRGQVSRADLAARAPDLWRYHEMLPVTGPGQVVSLGEGMTPLLAVPRLGRALGVPRLLMKDESLIPTGTFKARGAAVGVSRAAELGAAGVAMPTNGNAGAAWAAYAARAGLASLIVMPAAAPAINRAECAVAGAELYLVDGLIGDAAAIVAAALPGRPGYADVATLQASPTASRARRRWASRSPSSWAGGCPTSSSTRPAAGSGIIGIHKALHEMRELGWIGRQPLPRLVAVQSSGCAPDRGGLRRRGGPQRALAGRRGPHRGVRYHGAAGARRLPGAAARYASGRDRAWPSMTRTLLAAQREVARLEGSFICPEGAACVAAVGQLREAGWLSARDEVVVLNTGTGLKYPGTVPVDAPVLVPGERLPAG